MGLGLVGAQVMGGARAARGGGADGGMVGLRGFFFFQAEDGIRDTSVTGVQTCALPIFEEARRCEAAILGIPAMDTVKEVKRASLPEDVALITGTVPRERVVLAQTPQAFATKLLKEAFARAETDGVNASDEAGLVERMGHDVHVVLGSERNMKITKPADMELARFYMERDRKSTRLNSSHRCISYAVFCLKKKKKKINKKIRKKNKKEREKWKILLRWTKDNSYMELARGLGREAMICSVIGDK